MSGRRLPNAAQAIVDPAKISNYLMQTSPRRVNDKSGFFGRFGFRRQAPGPLVDAILRHAQDHDVTSTRITPYGTIFEVEGPLRTPDGRNPQVLVVWIIRSGETLPRLVTAVPSKAKPS
jgi:hypothetical protein